VLSSVEIAVLLGSCSWTAATTRLLVAAASSWLQLQQQVQGITKANLPLRGTVTEPRLLILVSKVLCSNQLAALGARPRIHQRLPMLSPFPIAAADRSEVAVIFNIRVGGM
jgi:hypothetical protein